MTGTDLYSYARQLRQLCADRLEVLRAQFGLLQAPWWAKLFPPAAFYVVGKSLAAETQTYLARAELEQRLAGYVAYYEAQMARAEAVGGAEIDGAAAYALGIEVADDCRQVLELVKVWDVAQNTSDRTLARLPEGAQVPLDVLARASWFAKYGVWLVLAGLALVLWYGRRGGLAAGAKTAASKVAGVVKG